MIFYYRFIDEHKSFLFTQLGLRNNTERSTANLGLGYRQYSENWMYGINTFLGLGGEAWTDYLKLAANSYFRLTDWHQSKISIMEASSIRF
ncbi:MAG TPA: inverse autotransporter beta domain-containing protein [Arsenophonus sp.]